MKRRLTVGLVVLITLGVALGLTSPTWGGENPIEKLPEPDMGEFRIQDPRLPVFRETVIVYFWEVPVSLEEFALKYGGRLIFAKEDIKMAAFETSSIGIPGETTQAGLNFISKVSRDSCVEKAFKDSFMFVAPESRLSLDPLIRYPEEFEENGWEYVPNYVSVGFWRLPPSVEEFASNYGGELLRLRETLLFAGFETSDMTEFIRKVSTDPYVRHAEPNSISKVCSEPVEIVELEQVREAQASGLMVEVNVEE